MRLAYFRKTISIVSAGLLAVLLIACEMPGKSSANVALPASGVSTPDVLLGPQAGELFNNGGQVYAVLNIYGSNASSPTQSINSNMISDQTATQVTWNVNLEGNLSNYTFEVVWKSTLYKEEDNVTAISFARSNKVPLQADNTLQINSYNYDIDSNEDGTFNIDAIVVLSQDPLACVLGASKINHCRLI